MSCYYDLHIHSALSPCGDDDMTPNNIVNMALLKGLDAIALTDHNSAKNVRVCFNLAKEAGIIFLPGMEIETSEDVHIVALFGNPDSAEKLDEIVSSKLPVIKNRTDIFGFQNVMDEDDNVIMQIPNLLSTATQLDIYEAVDEIRKLGGVAIPAHVDKSSYSVISNLGFIPEELDFSVLEIKNPDNKSAVIEKLSDKKIKAIHNSDAHFLWDIHEREHFFEYKFNNSTEIIEYLKQK